MWDMMVKCWDANPSDRPTIAEVMDQIRDVTSESNRESEADIEWSDPLYTQVWNDVKRPTLKNENPFSAHGSPPTDSDSELNWEDLGAQRRRPHVVPRTSSSDTYVHGSRVSGRRQVVRSQRKLHLRTIQPLARAARRISA
ncbi:hypothetical protein PM082_009039 [Marasmius tenuissimus]|nr:hypothetical protein PM082_009039 [Marasmius tenuissimus]